MIKKYENRNALKLPNYEIIKKCAFENQKYDCNLLQFDSFNSDTLFTLEQQHTKTIFRLWHVRQQLIPIKKQKFQKNQPNLNQSKFQRYCHTRTYIVELPKIPKFGFYLK